MGIVLVRAVDPHSFFADPEPADFLSADPDPAYRNLYRNKLPYKEL